MGNERLSTMNTTKVSRPKNAGAGVWQAMLGREWLEQCRTFKLLWVPLVFVLLGAMQPITSRFMPEIIKMGGGFPEGTVISIPIPTPLEVLASTLQQFNTIGILVIVLVHASALLQERTSGTAALVLVKQRSVAGFIGSKWLAGVWLALLSLSGGYGASWLYTELLIGKVQVSSALAGLLVYGCWMILAVTLSLFMSAWMRSYAGAAFLTLGVLVLLTVLASLLHMGSDMGYSPGALPAIATSLAGGTIMISSSLIAPMAVFIITIALLLWLTALCLRRRMDES